jgi:hydroxymethylglutaryl-CoA lyase
MRNTGKTVAQSLVALEEIINLSVKNNKEVVAYLSMGFGNPYGDPWNVEIVSEWTDTLAKLGVRILSLSDTIGVADGKTISYLFKQLIPMYPHIEFGAHLHTHPDSWHEKVDAAYKAGCYRFDGAIKGFGGCPMAKDELTGNMPTEKLLSYFTKEKIETGINPLRFEVAYNETMKVLG